MDDEEYGRVIVMVSVSLRQHRVMAFKKKCREERLRLTPQKLEIFSLLAGRSDHPTAEDIFVETQQKFPAMSLATVYRNLRQFVEMGVVGQVDVGDGSCHFDANMEDHDHIINTQTGEIRDICLPSKTCITDGITGNVVERVQVNVFVR